MTISIGFKRADLQNRFRFQALKKIGTYVDRWRLCAFGVALLAALPLCVIIFSFAHPAPQIWRHLLNTLLAEILLNTAVLAAGVLTGTLVLGVSLAWLTAVCDFPGRRLFSWALLLPLAMPTYVLAFVTLGLLDFSGPLQRLLRSLFPTPTIGFPEVRSAAGIIAVMTLSLYPYVFLLARSAFKTQGKRALEAAQSLGCSRIAAFFKVALPMARPWIAGGLLLVLMETLADFGAVSVFNFDTFTTAIYKAWFGFFSLPAAAQLSSLLVLIIFLVIALEQKMRNKMQFTQSGSPAMESDRIRLEGGTRRAATLFAATILLIAFVIPFGQLVVWSVQVFSEEFNARYLGFLSRSVFFALIASAAVCFAAVLLAYAQRLHKDRATTAAVRFATLGYALPGAVLAVGIVVAVSFADNLLAGLAGTFLGFKSGPIIQGTIVTVIAAYMVRFMAVGFNSINSAMHRVTMSLDEASITMGVKGLALLRRVHLPLLTSGMLTASMLVFVDVMKEMPITLMTRPFGWDTLAVKIFELTSEGEWQRAALPAVVLVLAGLIPVLVLTKQTETNQ